jgi:hypothetical protein
MGDSIYVEIDSAPGKWGPCDWVPKFDAAGKLVMPQIGDECLVLNDENNNPWIVCWRNN